MTGTMFRICLFFLVSLNLSFQWPVKNPKLTSTFGESREDHFHDGIDVAGQDKKVYPAGEGVLIYFWNRSLFPVDNYPGGGNYAVLKHDNNMYSIYLHLADSPLYREIYTENDVLGIFANTGRSYGNHLHFSLINLAERTSRNPLELLQRHRDANKPVIGDFRIRIGDKYFVIRDKAQIRLTKNYPLLIEVADNAGGREKMGIFSITAVLNGKPVLEINFSKIEYSKNGLTISQNTFQDLFDEKGYYKIKDVHYLNGANTLKVNTRDFNGNECTREITFNVNLQLN